MDKVNKVIRTPMIRMGYVNIAKPRLNDKSGKMEYSCQLLIHKTETDFVAEINRVHDAIALEHYGNPDKIPPMLKRQLRDADAEGKKEAHYGGHYFMNLRSDDKPGIVGPDGLPMATPEECRSGDWFRVSMGGFWYDKGTPGISFGLNNVQWCKKGETISGRQRAEDEFGPVGDAESDAHGLF